MVRTKSWQWHETAAAVGGGAPTLPGGGMAGVHYENMVRTKSQRGKKGGELRNANNLGWMAEVAWVWVGVM